MYLTKIFTISLLLLAFFAKAQKVKEIYINLYTDSLKKGTYNYINVDGRLANKNFTPLDSSQIIFWSSDGKFYGNSLLIDKDFEKDKVDIQVTLKSDPAITKKFTMYIKRKEDNERLKTTEELLQDLKNDAKAKNRKKA